MMNETTNNNYLPVGTIIRIEGCEEKIMIAGYKIGDGTNTYDYSGIIYPVGLIKKNEVMMFNKSEIIDIIFTGYEGEEFLNFKNIIDSSNVNQ